MSAERLLQIIVGPHVSEKTTRGTEQQNAYVFKVATRATKPEIKQAVEQLLKVKVDGVRVVNVKPKVKHFRGMAGTRKRWKKAYITIVEGQKIDLLEGNNQ